MMDSIMKAGLVESLFLFCVANLVFYGYGLQQLLADKETIVKISTSGKLIQCSAAIDILLVMDGSYSIGKGSFERSKHFAAKLFDVLDINPDRVQVGVIQYSSKSKVEFALDAYPTREEAKDAIKKIRLRGGGTEIGRAIKDVLRKGFPGGRNEVPKIMVILTDGKSQDNVTLPAIFAKKSGITLFAVGIKYPKWKTLHSLASEPSEMYVFFAEHYDDAVNGLYTTLTQITVCSDIHPYCKVESRYCLRTTIEAEKEFQGNHMCWKGKPEGLYSKPMATLCPFYRWKRINSTVLSRCHRTICPDPCESTPCQNGGTCLTESVEEYSCLCPLGYGGDKHCGGDRYLIPAGLSACAVDLVFLIDGSWHMGLHGFLMAKDFMKRLAHSVFVSSHKVQIGVVQYGDKVHMEINLQFYQSISELNRQIDGISFRGGNTFTGKALDYMAQHGFKVSQGSRMEVPHVLILLSNSKSHDLVTLPAERAKEKEIFILTVGGHRLFNDMNLITGDSRMVFSFHDEQELFNKVLEMRTKLCGLNSPGCFSKSLDLVFVLDASNNVGRNDFRLIKTFIKNIISQFDIDSDLTQIALVIYNKKPRMIFSLDTFDSEGAMKKSISLAPYLGGHAQTGKALRFVLEDATSTKKGARPGVTKVVLVVTNGQSADDVSSTVDQLWQDGITLLVIGTGEAQSPALLKIARSPKFMIPVPSYEHLKHYEANLVRKICNGKNNKMVNGHSDFL
ncbi:von Willebrand factor A domain-containing protein 2-like [Polypterus senegalus]|uniref:von Willebrand factor A domain-containing protein 2-like n=1 Tax=Polypterus senegalus TaxID=55291 RepID=UPI0019638EEB|nr:von Willebrand factor A domain-containing protein 2-like [Polypterus senegalus]